MRNDFMNFFNPEDFDDIPINDTWDTSIVAERANSKLKREGTTVFQHKENKRIWQEYTTPFLALTKDVQGRKQAILIRVPARKRM